MLYELSIHEVIILRNACAVAQARVAENAKFAERNVGNPNMSEDERASAARVAEWYQAWKVAFGAIRKALDEGREITTLAQAKEALER